MNILLINITRFGDTLQAQPLINTLYENFNDKQNSKIGLICIENFVEAGQLLQNISDIFPLPASYFLKTLANKKEHYLEALNVFELYIKNIIDTFKPDLVINLTPTVVARLISKKISLYLENKEKKIPLYAYTLDDFGFSLNSNVWASYIQAVTLNRLSSPFNLADGFTLLGSIDILSQNNSIDYSAILARKEAQNPSIRPSTKEETKKARLLLTKPLDEISLNLERVAHENKAINTEGVQREIHNTQKLGYIAFQLGASAEKRQYSIKNFAKLSSLLHAKGYTIVLLGSKKEEDIVEKFYLADGIGINLVGKTELNILAAVLRQCDLIISNDTGTMHLAAGVGLPILALFLATAQAWDTGPISTDACLIEPNLACHPCSFSHECTEDYACKNVISPQILAEIAHTRLQSGIWQQHFSAQARIWQSTRDEEGYLVLKALDILEKNKKEALYYMQRTIYKNTLELLANIKPKEALNLSNSQKLVSYINNMDKTEKEKLLVSLTSLCDLFVLLQQQAKLMGNIEKMKHGFLATNQKISSLFKSNPSTLALAYLWDYCMQASDIETSSFFENMQKFETILNEWKNAILK